VLLILSTDKTDLRVFLRMMTSFDLENNIICIVMVRTVISSYGDMHHDFTGSDERIFELLRLPNKVVK
jgi:hypothetical protein